MGKLTKTYTLTMDGYKVLLSPSCYKGFEMTIIKSPEGKPKEVSAVMLYNITNTVFEELSEEECMRISYGRYTIDRGESMESLYQHLLTGLTF